MVWTARWGLEYFGRCARDSEPSHGTGKVESGHDCAFFSVQFKLADVSVGQRASLRDLLTMVRKCGCEKQTGYMNR